MTPGPPAATSAPPVPLASSTADGPGAGGRAGRLGRGGRLTYGLIAAGLLLRLVGGHWVLARVWRKAHPARNGPTSLFRRLAASACPRAELLVSARPVGPVCFGVLRPRVLVPAGVLAAGDGPAVRAVFAHELAHLGRRDPLAGWLLGLARAAYFVCPWLAGLRREVRVAQECLADADAARQAAGPADYAELLIRMARSRPAPLGAAGARGPSSELYRRVTMLLRNPGGVERPLPAPVGPGRRRRADRPGRPGRRPVRPAAGGAAAEPDKEAAPRRRPAKKAAAPAPRPTRSRTRWRN